MGKTTDDLKEFSQFVLKHCDDDESNSRLPELFDLWMLQKPSDDVYVENVEAINASLNDFISGERGTPAGQHSQELRSEFGLRNR